MTEETEPKMAAENAENEEEKALVGINAKTHYIGLDLPGLRHSTNSYRRIKGKPGEDMYYHVMSRMTDNLPMWDSLEKEALCRLMAKLAGFCGVELYTYCVMGNHFHALVKVPDREQWLKKFQGEGGEERFFEHLHGLYSQSYVKRLRGEIELLRAGANPDGAEKVIAAFQRRFCDVSIWTKEVKERFAKWLNKRRQRRGTMWMERYKSVLVQNGEALRTMGLYIDLNPVRAGIVLDPADYRWSGYGAAVGGGGPERVGLAKIVGDEKRGWGEVQKVYRTWLYAAGSAVVGEDGKVVRKGLSAEQVEEVEKAGGEMGVIPALGHRIRYLSEGLVLGSRGWVEEVYQSHRENFGRKRKVGARELKATGGSEMCTLRG